MSFRNSFRNSFSNLAAQDPPVASSIVLSPAGASVEQDSGILYTATVKDQYGATFNTTSVMTFGDSGVAGSWDDSAPACVGGVATATFTPSGFGDATITADFGSVPQSAQPLAVTEKPVIDSLVVTPNPVVVNNGDTVPVTVQALDQFGNPFDDSVTEVTLGTQLGPTGTWSDASPILSGGTATVDFTATGAGSGIITASATGVTGGSATLTVNAGTVTTTLVKISGDDVLQTPNSNQDLVVEVRENGTPVANRVVTAAIQSGPGSLVNASATTNGSGQATITLTTGATIGTTVVRLTSDAVNADYTVRVPDRILRFNPEASEGEQGGTTRYRLRVAADAGNKVWDAGDLALAYDEKPVGFGFNAGTGKYEWDLSDPAAFPVLHGTTREGLFDLGVTAVDAAGNDSGSEGTVGFMEIEDAWFWYG